MSESSRIGGVAMANIKTISEVDVPQKWDVVKSWNWGEESTHTFSDGSAQAFQGIDWTSRNTALADGIAVKSSGLEIGITDSEATSRWYHTTQTGPVVFAKLADIVSGFSLSDTIAIQCIMDPVVDTIQGSDQSGQHVYGGLVVFDGGYGAGASGNWYNANWYRQLSATTNYYNVRYGGGNTPADAGDPVASDSTGGGAPTFIELIIYPATGWTSGMSSDTTFQEPLTVSTGVYHGNMQTSIPSDVTNNPGPTDGGGDPEFTLRPSNMRVGMWASYLTTAGSRGSAVTVTFKKFRVLKRNV
jgi:hypothetical protein